MARRTGVGFRIAYFLYSRTPIGRLYFLRELRQAAQKFPDGHSVADVTTLGDVNVLSIPYSNDNYAYMIWRVASDTCVLVDPGHPAPVLAVLKQKNLKPSSILITHKHWDHAYGSKKIRRAFSNVTVYGSSEDAPLGITQTLTGDSEIKIDSLRFRALSTPGHTLGHTAYVLLPEEGPPCLFSGDSLFLGGVGRMFEGDAAMYLESLDKLCALPLDTLLFPGHEYAVNNLEFVIFLDPDNEEAISKLKWALERRCDRLPASPSRLAEEFCYNPYLRLELKLDHWINAFQIELQPVNNNSLLREKVFLEIRRRKDAFKFIV